MQHIKERTAEMVSIYFVHLCNTRTVFPCVSRSVTLPCRGLSQKAPPGDQRRTEKKRGRDDLCTISISLPTCAEREKEEKEIAWHLLTAFKANAALFSFYSILRLDLFLPSRPRPKLTQADSYFVYGQTDRQPDRQTDSKKRGREGRGPSVE